MADGTELVDTQDGGRDSMCQSCLDKILGVSQRYNHDVLSIRKGSEQDGGLSTAHAR